MKHATDHASLLARIEALLGGERPGAHCLVALRLRQLDAIEAEHGAAAAAHVIGTARERLAELCADTESPSDLGEGVLAMVHRAEADAVEEFARDALAAVTRPVLHRGRALHAPANVGACTIDRALGDAAAHVERALRSLQQAMSRGAGSVEVACEARIERAAADWEMRTQLQGAQHRGELRLEYQSIHRIADGGVRAVEALLRWDHPQHGRVHPERFIPMLEDSGYISAVGEWVLAQACRDLRGWRAQGAGVRVAINVSPMQLRGGFEHAAERIAVAGGCEPSWFELEITEGLLVRDFARITGPLDALVAMGFSIAIDDFGAGYSSLGQLAQLPVHHLKMDRSLLQGVPGARKAARIVRAVVALAEGLGLSVTAEGIEDAAQAGWLAAFPGMQGQGYYFSRPMDAAAVSRLLLETR
ncbi:MAG TPA: EAL domain-containing protein [Usitatibacter sp.]|nr:EAL domain-containing protein [Usitatibacter sp.]